MYFSSGVYLYFRILMYVKRHKQFKIACGTILNKIYYYYFLKVNFGLFMLWLMFLIM